MRLVVPFACRAGIHALRHTFGTHLITADV